MPYDPLFPMQLSCVRGYFPGRAGSISCMRSYKPLQPGRSAGRFVAEARSTADTGKEVANDRLRVLTLLATELCSCFLTPCLFSVAIQLTARSAPGPRARGFKRRDCVMRPSLLMCCQSHFPFSPEEAHAFVARLSCLMP
ncbi:hypothetical protein CSUI_008443 [Cystoisospora suis]|uniref:Uncharacterized protein n=1 Tax=Cystoisospora suis TaxID=483139 RepID=A0A2C6K9A4_9APIC|nr:hypothetical protein CSUI_008443 [Cystoisospora suis]